MSRAFVDESDSNIKEDDIPELVIPLPPGVKNYMTPKGAETVKRELQELEQTVRPQLASQVSKNVTDGDSVNSDLVVSVRRKMRVIDRRIEYLSKMIDRMEVIDPKTQAADCVRFGTTVTVMENGTYKRVFRIVGVDESDPKRGCISWISPIAKSLISRAVGDTVKISLPKGETHFKVAKIDYE
jgi:transcription elongation factor GreB